MLARLLAGSRPSPPTAQAAAGATVLGFGAVAVVEAILGPASYSPGSAADLAARTLWGVSSILLCGCAYALVVALVWAAAERVAAPLRSARPRLARAIPWALLAAASTAVAYAFLPDALDLAAHALLGGRHGTLLLVVYLVAVGVGIASLAAAGHLLSRRRWLRWIPIALALVGMYENQVILADDYPELHCALGWSIAVLFGFSSSTLLAVLAHRPRLGRSLGILAGAAALFALVVPAPNLVRLTLFRSAGSGAWPMGMVVWRLPELPAPVVPEGAAEWFATRTALPPVGPTVRPPSDEAPVVVLITVDAFRGDLLRDRKLDVLWPTLARLRDESVYFPHARAPGGQTAVSMATLFTGRYFSQLYWTKYGEARARLDYPVLDDAPRFSTLLTDAGVATYKVASVRALANEFGLAPGFAEEIVLPAGRGMAPARQVMKPLLERLTTLDGRPQLVFTHFLDAHGPYTAGVQFFPQVMKMVPRAPKKPSGVYLGALVAVDRALADLVEVLETPALAGRAMLILSADHGEAFGEHGYLEHAKSLHEELLDVPLLIHAKGLRPHVVEERVGLIDLGPTILDWFGHPTPASFMGQSLVPLLLERPARLTRPLLAEGRLRRALVLGDLKLIVDERRKVMEAYDLAADPGETLNLWDTDRARLGDVSAALRAFFDAHEYRANGYRPVFRR